MAATFTTISISFCIRSLRLESFTPKQSVEISPATGTTFSDNNVFKFSSPIFSLNTLKRSFSNTCYVCIYHETNQTNKHQEMNPLLSYTNICSFTYILCSELGFLNISPLLVSVSSQLHCRMPSPQGTAFSHLVVLSEFSRQKLIKVNDNYVSGDNSELLHKIYTKREKNSELLHFMYEYYLKWLYIN